MTTRKALTITACLECHHTIYDTRFCIYVSKTEPRLIPNKFTIPTWCPLEDYRGEQDRVWAKYTELMQQGKVPEQVRGDDYRKAVKVIRDGKTNL